MIWLKIKEKNVERKYLKNHCSKKLFRDIKNKIWYIYNDKTFI